MIKYRTNRSNAVIEEVECEKETAKCIFVKGNRFSKDSQWVKFHDTWEEAQAFLINKYENESRQLRLAQQRVSGFLGNAKGLKR